METTPQNPEEPSIREQLPEALRTLFADAETVRTTAVNIRAVDNSVQPVVESFERQGQRGVFELYGSLITAAAADEPGWGQNERDAATAITREFLPATLIQFPNLNRMRLVDSYAETVEGMPGGGDYFAAPHSLYELGTVLFKGLGTSSSAAETYQAQMKVRSAWTNFFPHIEDESERAQAKELIERMVETVLPRPVAAQGELSPWEWVREQPKMNEDTTRLHDAYLTEVRTMGSYKPYLAAHTPQFQEQLHEVGLELPQYLNLSDPELAVHAVQELVGMPGFEHIVQRFDRSYVQRYALSLADLANAPQLAAVMADQINEHMDLVVHELTTAIANAEQLYERVYDQAVGAVDARKPGRKLSPVRNFLEAYGVATAGLAPASVVALMDDPAIQAAIMEQINERKVAMETQIAYLHHRFPENPYRHLRMMPRDESDLYTADETRDCTAYHLENGFNGWTLPHWLANPGFNMVYVYDQGVRIAKLGLQLAEDETGLRLVVDSIEVTKHAPEGFESVNAISSGVLELQEWADRLGLGDIIFCTYTNSSELTAELPVISPETPPTRLGLFRNAAGLQEVWQSATGDDDVIDPGYIQAEDSSDADAAAQAAEANEGAYNTLSDLEIYLRPFTTPELAEAARQGDWRGVITAFVAKAMPLTEQVFGPGAPFYEQNRTRMGHFGTLVDEQRYQITTTDELLSGIVKKDDVDGYIHTMGETKFKGITVKDIGPLISISHFRALQAEAKRLEDLESIVQALNYYQMSIEEGLQHIFGVETEESQDQNRTVKLRLNLPVVNRWRAEAAKPRPPLS